MAKVPRVVIACCILHNVCSKMQIVDSSVPMPSSDDDNTHHHHEESENLHRVGNAVRQHYIERDI